MTDPTAELMRRLAGKWAVQAIATAAELGIADVLAEGPRTSEALAASLGCQPDPLARLLRALAGEGLVELGVDDRYALTPLGDALRTGRLRELAVWLGSAAQWDPWHALTHTIRTGEPAFEHVHGQGLYEYLASHPEDAARYDAAIDAFTRATAHALADRCDLNAVGTIADIGGGRGTLLRALLERAPNLRGILFDLEHVVAAARDLPDRCQTVAGDFFESVPSGADVYVLKHILHNWGDDDALRILSSCKAAVPASGRVWVVEAVVLPGNRRGLPRLLDLEMLVLTPQGRERTQPQLRRLFHRGGFRIANTTALTGAVRLLELTPR